ncbi:MAG: saccharopine dehydrogenase C-terminal domain-containing protein, partial [Saprospiraceae bacterium]
MARIAVLGAGMVGSTIARALSMSHEILLLDIDADRLKTISNHKIKTLICDLVNVDQLSTAIATSDLVLGAVPGHLGYEVLKNVIQAGKNIVDISFFSEDASSLHALAKKNKVVAIHDCGVAPGMDNIILGYHDRSMKVTSFKCMVGGLPIKKNPPFDYKAPFSPIDVLEEYTRPARLKIKGKVITKPALTDIETIKVNKLGNLEAFNSDGLRSLLKTMNHIPNMVEKTIRYPGHAKQMEWVREVGLLNKNSIDVRGHALRPLDLTSKLLFSQWDYKPGEEDFTLMIIQIEGIEA